MSDVATQTAYDLAAEALAIEERTGRSDVADQLSEMLGASSQTLQEAFMTAVRVKRAEARARAWLQTLE